MKKKGLLITIIILLILLILAGGAFAYVYFTTDLFKTDKQLFAKYSMQIVDEENGFIPSSLKEYYNKKSNTAYQNEGQITANTQILFDTSTDQYMQQLQESVQEALNYANNTNVTFSGAVDNLNKRAEQDVTINYTDDVNLPFKYKRYEDTFGIQADSILTGYMLAIENNNLPAMLQNLGVTNVEEIPYKIETKEIESLNFTEEEKTHLVDSYIVPMYNNLSDDQFSKTSNSDGSVTYMLTISNQELIDILVQILQTLSTDNLMIDKINSVRTELDETNTEPITSSDIQNMLDEISNETVEEGNTVEESNTAEDVNLAISVTVQGGMATKIEINTNRMLMQISKTQNDTNLSYEITVTIIDDSYYETSSDGLYDETSIDNLDDETSDVQPIDNTLSSEISLTMTYSGLSTDVVSENVNIGISLEEEMIASYNYLNNITFGNSVDIQPMDANTTILINNYTIDQLQPFMEQLATKIEEVNKSQMEQIGYPADMGNPIIMWYGAYSYYSLAKIYPALQNSISAAEETMNEQLVATNNQTFLSYGGIQSGSNVESLCRIVINHNQTTDLDEQVNVKFGEEASATTFATSINDIEQIINNIDASNTYNITFSYDATTGFICEIGIVMITQ